MRRSSRRRSGRSAACRLRRQAPRMRLPTLLQRRRSIEPMVSVPSRNCVLLCFGACCISSASGGAACPALIRRCRRSAPTTRCAGHDARVFDLCFHPASSGLLISASGVCSCGNAALKAMRADMALPPLAFAQPPCRPCLALQTTAPRACGGGSREARPPAGGTCRSPPSRATKTASCGRPGPPTARSWPQVCTAAAALPP